MVVTTPVFLLISKPSACDELISPLVLEFPQTTHGKQAEVVGVL
jgi:hypothetical protein